MAEDRISNRDIMRLHFEKAIQTGEALAMCRRLGLDERELSAAIGVQYHEPGESPEDKTPAWRVTARGIRAPGEGIPDGKPFPFVWAGGCPWPALQPKEGEEADSATFELSERQMSSVRHKASLGRIVVLKSERIKREEEKPAQPQQTQQQARR